MTLCREKQLWQCSGKQLSKVKVKQVCFTGNYSEERPIIATQQSTGLIFDIFLTSIWQLSDGFHLN